MWDLDDNHLKYKINNEMTDDKNLPKGRETLMIVRNDNPDTKSSMKVNLIIGKFTAASHLSRN